MTRSVKPKHVLHFSADDVGAMIAHYLEVKGIGQAKNLQFKIEKNYDYRDRAGSPFFAGAEVELVPTIDLLEG